LIFVVGDVEARLQPDVCAEFAQRLRAKSVNRPALYALGARAQLPLETRCDLAGGFVREGEDADALRIETALLDQKSDALDQAECLAGPGTSKNQYRIR